MTPIDVALLVAEWCTGRYLGCPVCAASTSWQHEAGCAMDLALAERGFATQADRDAARRRIENSRLDTPPEAA
jgi:hypothetical protein